MVKQFTKEMSMAFVVLLILGGGIYVTTETLQFKQMGTGWGVIEGEWNNYDGKMLRINFDLTTNVKRVMRLTLPANTEIEISDKGNVLYGKKYVTLKAVNIDWEVLPSHSILDLHDDTYDLAKSRQAIDMYEEMETRIYKVADTSWEHRARLRLTMTQDNIVIQEPKLYELNYRTSATDIVLGSGEMESRGEVLFLGWLEKGMGEVATDWVVVNDPNENSHIYKRSDYNSYVNEWNTWVKDCTWVWNEFTYENFWNGVSTPTGRFCDDWDGMSDGPTDYAKNNLGSSSVEEVKLSDNKIIAIRDAAGFTSRIDMTFTGDLVGGVKEIRMDAKVGEIKTSKSSINLNDNDYENMIITVTNTGYGDGDITVSLESSILDIVPETKTLKVKKDDESKFNVELYPEYVSDDSNCEIIIKAVSPLNEVTKIVPCKIIYTGEGSSALKTIITEKSKLEITDNTMKFVSYTDADWSGQLLAVSSNAPTSKLSTFNLFGNTQFDTNADEVEEFSYGTLLYFKIKSNKPFEVYQNGEFIEQLKPNSSYTKIGIIFYGIIMFLVIIPVILIIFMIRGGK